MKSIRVTVSLPHEEHEKLQNLAEENNLSLSWLVRQAVNRYLNDVDDTGLLTAANNKTLAQKTDHGDEQ